MTLHRYHWFGIFILIGLFGLSTAHAESLHDAAFKGDLSQVKRLIAKGVDVNTIQNDGATALMLAVNKGRGSIIQILLAKGADVNAKTNKGWTALVAAKKMRREKIVQMLIKAGAK